MRHARPSHLGTVIGIIALSAACTMGGTPPDPVNVADVEPNNTTAGADANTVIPALPAHLTGSLQAGNIDEMDLFRLNLAGETTIEVTTTCAGNLTLTIGLLNQAYTAPCNATVTWGDVPGGTWYVRVAGGGPDPGHSSSYTIDLSVE